MNIPEVGFEHAVSGNFTVPAILAHSGIRGEEDTLLILDPAILNDFPNFQENTIILYEFGKMAGKQFVSWQDALVDLNYQGTEKTFVLQQWMKPIPWTREIICCTPNKRIEGIKPTEKPSYAIIAGKRERYQADCEFIVTGQDKPIIFGK